MAASIARAACSTHGEQMHARRALHVAACLAGTQHWSLILTGHASGMRQSILADRLFVPSAEQNLNQEVKTARGWRALGVLVAEKGSAMDAEHISTIMQKVRARRSTTQVNVT